MIVSVLIVLFVLFHIQLYSYIAASVSLNVQFSSVKLEVKFRDQIAAVISEIIGRNGRHFSSRFLL